MHIGGKDTSTGERVRIHPPHDIAHTLGYYHKGGGEHVQQAIQAALDARESWQHTPADERAAIFLKAADLFAGKYRYAINATTMLGQSKNVFQAEIDASCELIDFLRFNVHYMYHIYRQQPVSAPGMRNSLDYRPLEGFVFAVTPFNFTAIAGNLAIVPAMLGNVVVWKPAETQIYSARLIMDVLLEAGLPRALSTSSLQRGRWPGRSPCSILNWQGLTSPAPPPCFAISGKRWAAASTNTGVIPAWWEKPGEKTLSWRTTVQIPT